MKKLLKSYFAFTSVSYRLVWMLLIPALLFWLALLAVSVDEGTNLTLRIVPVSYLIVVEILSDYFFMGDVCAERGKHMVCFRTSMRGSSVLQCVLWGDLLRRFLYCAVYSLICLVAFGDVFGMVEGLLVYMGPVLTINITRYVSGFMQTMGIGMIASAVFAVVYGICGMLFAAAKTGIGITVGLAGMLLCAALFSVITVKHVQWRTERNGN